MDTLDWSYPRDDTMPTTYASINNDLRNLTVLFEEKYEGINCINTCAVDYLGYRVII